MDDVKKQLEKLPTLSIRLDRQDMINQLRGLSDNYIELLLNPKHLKTIVLKDRRHYNIVETRQ